MRTNKERVDEVFKRAEAYNSSTLNEKVAEKKSSHVKPWVKWVSCTLAAVIVIGALVGLILGILNRNSFNLDNMYIANFSKYKAIGAGGADTTAEEILSANTSSISTYSSESLDDDMYLVGVDENNNIERCRVNIDGSSGSPEHSIDYKVRRIFSYEQFTIVSFDPFMSSGFKTKYSYVINNETGKFYSLDKFGEYTKIDFGTFSDGTYSEADRSFGDNALYMLVDIQGGTNDKYIYKLYFENGKLVLEEVYDYSLNVVSEDNFFVDRFGNLYFIDTVNPGNSRNGLTPPELNITYIISNGEIQRASDIGINGLIFKSINGICYTADKSKYIDENGTLQDNDFQECDYFFSLDEKVKTVGGVDYYFAFSDYFEQGNTNLTYKLFKVTWQNDIEFSVENIEIQEEISIKDYVVTEDYLYVIEEDKISTIEIITGNLTPLNSEYIFTSIQTDYLGNVIFYGSNRYMQKVIGIINNEKQITVLTKPRDYRIYYITAVNR